jgi:hypothetical protein
MRSLLLAVLLALASPAGAQPQLQLRQRLVGMVQPLGAEHRLDLSLLMASDADDPVWRSFVRVGMFNASSPVFTQTGVYVAWSPAAFVVLRGSLAHLGLWSIPLSGAGYYVVESPQSPWAGADLPAGEGGRAVGRTARFSTTLQGAIDLGARWRLVVFDEVALHWIALGEAPYYVSVRHGLVLAQEDWVLRNDAFLGLEVRPSPGLTLRFGAYDDARHVPSSRQLQHQVGAMTALTWEPEGRRRLRQVDVFLRGGAFTHHGHLEGHFTALGGLQLRYDLGGAR